MIELFTRAGFEPFVLALPATTLAYQWRDDAVAKVGGKIFALLDRDPGEIWLKVNPLAFDMLPELPGVRPAPYFARAGWVAIAPDAPLTSDEVAAYLRDAHRLVARRLSRRQQQKLGLADTLDNAGASG